MERSGESSGVTTSASLGRLIADPAHGPLPALMLVLTVLTGVVDAVSILSLGRVFVANMTGNVVFVGFALAGADGFSLSASLSALGGFLVGAAVGGAAVERLAAHRGRLGRRHRQWRARPDPARAVCCGPGRLPPRSSCPRRHRRPLGPGDGRTERRRPTTQGLRPHDDGSDHDAEGIAADVRPGDRFAIVRRVLAVAAMLVGAVAGALLVLEVSDVAALGLAASLLVIVVGVASAGIRSPAPWHAPRPEVGGQVGAQPSATREDWTMHGEMIDVTTQDGVADAYLARPDDERHPPCC